MHGHKRLMNESMSMYVLEESGDDVIVSNDFPGRLRIRDIRGSWSGEGSLSKKVSYQ